jgi:hypothetical protein
MLLLERRKGRDDRVCVVTHRPVAANEVRVDVREPGSTTVKAAFRVQVEEDGAAARERFGISIEVGRVVAA